MQKITIFFILILTTTHCFSNLEDYINQEFERNRSSYGCIKHLDFGSNKIGDFKPLGGDGLGFLLQKQNELSHLESLNLEGNQITEKLAHYFIEQLVIFTPNLKKINLSYNPIGYLGAVTIGNVCFQWPTLETLQLNNAAIHSKGLVDLFSTLSKHPTLKNLDVASNAKLNYKSAYQLGLCFVAFKHLEYVSLENLGLNEAHMDGFLSGMNHPSDLKSCAMPLKTIHFGDRLSLSQIKQFFYKLIDFDVVDFYYQSNMFRAHKENGSLKISKYTNKIEAKL